ncbi:MAG: hypothetical protein IT448_00810 [Phycisphaerales bacterium]|nr:hypothetical protein [Phycisphaerales bacterium]
MIRLFCLAALGLLIGCASGRPTLIPNADADLRKSSAEFAADAAKRFPYPAAAQRGGQAMGRAQVGYALDVLEIVNQSKEDWNDVTVWINDSYVVHLSKMQPQKLKRIPFQMIYNDKGQYFPLDNRKVLMEKVELYQGGVLYDVPLQLAD